jgi:hypothetical protein
LSVKGLFVRQDLFLSANANSAKRSSVINEIKILFYLFDLKEEKIQNFKLLDYPIKIQQKSKNQFSF